MYAACLVLLVLASVADAWWCTGHMVVSDVARQLIEEKVPSLNRKIEAVLRDFTASGPWPANGDITQIACWADDIKRNLNAMNNWHYITKAYNPQNLTLPSAAELSGGTNIVTQLDSTYKSLKNNPNVWEAGFSLAWVVHLLGDIHQPCHTCTLYDNNFPYPLGDVGGNFFDIVVDGHKNKLHKYWDSACETLGFDFERPLSAAQSKNISDIALSYIQEFGPTITTSEEKVYSPATIADASHLLAVEFAYANSSLQPHGNLTKDYQDNCRRVTRRQITLGGYRLANQLIYLLNKTDITGLNMEPPTPSPLGKVTEPNKRQSDAAPDSGMSGGTAAAIVMGCLIVLLCGVGAAVFLKKGRQRPALTEGDRLAEAEVSYGKQ